MDQYNFYKHKNMHERPLQKIYANTNMHMKKVLSIISLCVLATLTCPTLCDPMDSRIPDSSVHGILQQTC